MDFKIVGKGLNRTDARAKVTGKAKYTADFNMEDMLYARIFRSTIAHGYVKSIDTSEAEELEGVVKVVTYKDVPDTSYPTAGHPYCKDPKHQDCADKKILTDRVRFYGDEIAAVVAEDELTAAKALKLIKVEYEELPVLLDAEEAMKDGAPPIHEWTENNIEGQNQFSWGDEDIEKAFEKSDYIFEGVYEVSPVQHVQLENHIAYAYMDDRERVNVVTSTQIPHVCRRILAQALELPYGRIRVVKPYIGGGFGNKQDVVVEPLAAFLTLQLGGRPVTVDTQREENMIGSRTRHKLKFFMKTGVRKDGRFLARQLKAVSDTGAYSSHGHAIASKQGVNFSRSYPAELATKFEGYTVYTNKAAAGAMRSYGIAQINHAMESHVDDIARGMEMNPVELRNKNRISLGFKDPISGIQINSCGLPECIEKARDYIDYDRKYREYANQTGDKRRGVGLSCFTYATAVWPILLEIAGVRILMNQDGTMQMFMGATEIGQGAETIFCQMAAETVGVPFEYIHLEPTNDTDISPFDSGAYASRQAYVSGRAVKEAATQIRDQVLERAAVKLSVKAEDLDIVDANIVRKSDGAVLTDLEDIALDAFYCTESACTIKAEVSKMTESNALAFGATAVEVEVDMKTGKVSIIDIINVHDSGTILNRTTAEGQVHGGISMSLGLALSEVMLYHPETGKPLNNNLLDYKMPTLLDSPDFSVDFVETYEESGPYGNKALGEPPTVSPSSAVRNAILNATGVSFNNTPMNPQRLFERFKAEGLV